MSSTFTNVFRKVINSTSLKEVTAGTGLSAIMGSLNKYKNYIVTHSGPVDSLIMALTQCSDLIPDALLNDGVTEYDVADVGRWTVEVPSEVEDSMISGLSEAIHNNMNSTGLYGLTMTSSVGELYNIIDVRSLGTVDGVTPLFSTVYQPNHKEELLLYRDGGKVYLNSLIRSADYAKVGASRIKPDSVEGRISSMALISKGQSLNNIIGDLELMECYNGNLLSSLNFISGMQDSTIMDASSHAWDAINSQYPVQEGKGHVNSLYNLIYDQIESSVFNQWIAAAIGALQSNSIDSASIAMTMKDGLENRFSSVREFSKSFVSAFTKGGLYGAASYIVEYIKAMANNLTDSDGRLQFTDNSRLVPSQYIIGMVSNIINAVGSLISLVASIFSRIAGAALAILGTVASGLVSALTYDYDSTNSAVSQSERCLLPTAPMALLKGEINSSDIHNDDFWSLVNMGYTTFTLQVPGGYLFVGPGTMAYGSVYSWRFEFHPSIVSTDDAIIKRIWDIWYEHDRVSLTVYESINAAKILINFDPYDAELIKEYWGMYIQDKVFTNSADTERLSDTDDLAVEKNCMKNSFIFYIWCCCFTTGLWSSQNNQGVFSIDPGNYLYPFESSGYEWYTGLASALFFFLPGTQYFYVGSGEDMKEYKMSHTYSATVEFPSWAFFLKTCFSEARIGSSTAYGSVSEYILNNNSYYNSIEPLDAEFSHLLLIPKYDKSTFWFWVVMSAVTTAVIAGVAVLVAIKARKAILQKRALNQAKVDAAWSDLTKNPSPETYTAYKKAVKSNNRWARLIGGTRYDYVNYWNGDVSGEGEASGTILNKIKDKFNETNDSYGTSLNELGVDDTVNMSDILYSIVGRPNSSNP